MIMMPYGWRWSSLQLTGQADFWHPTGGRADRGEYSGAGPRAAQAGCVEAGDGGLDARRQVPGVVVEHL